MLLKMYVSEQRDQRYFHYLLRIRRTGNLWCSVLSRHALSFKMNIELLC
jgi:hypothetical protein